MTITPLFSTHANFLWTTHCISHGRTNEQTKWEYLMMKRYVWLMMGLIFTVIMGCSKGDKKNSSQPGPQAATPALGEATLTAGEGNEMTFTLRMNADVQVVLTGEVHKEKGMLRVGTLSNEDGSRTADVMSVSDKKHTFVVFHGSEKGPESDLYLFTLNSGVYSLRISEVTISRSNALNRILSALEVHIDAGMDLDAAVSHMVNAFNADNSLTFEAYAGSLSSSDPVILDPEEEEQEEEEEEEKEKSCYEQNNGCERRDDNHQADQDHRHPHYDKEPTPVAFPPAIKPQVTERSAPRPRPRPTHGGGGAGVVTEAPGGRNVIVHCYPGKSLFVVEESLRALPRMAGCFDRNHKEDKFRASVVLDQSMVGIDSMKGLKLRVDIDLGETYFMKRAKFWGRPVIWPNNGARIHKGTSDTTYYGPSVAVFSAYYEMDSKFRDSMRVDLTCKIQRTHRPCGR